MSKDNNLTDFLTDVADAIREKKGTTAKINPQNFSDEIRNLASGGGDVVEVERKDVNFYDYDGTLLFSYTIAEAQALTELPTPKGHEGLVFQGWNWDYEEVIALDYPMDIGAMYITDDGKTRFYLEVEDEEGVDIELGFTQTANDVMVDFGDGSPVQSYPDAKPIIPHHYAKGSYVLRMWSQGKKKYTFEQPASTRNTFGGVANASSTILKKIELGENGGVSSYAFLRCTNLETVSVFREIKGTFGWNASFQRCLRLKHINIPKGSQYLYGSIFEYCLSLRCATIPNSSIHLNDSAFARSGLRNIRITPNANFFTTSPIRYTEIEEFIFMSKTTSFQGFFRECKRLKKVVNIQGCVISDHFFYGCFSLEEVEIPENQTTISKYCFSECQTLRELLFHKGITTINGYAFSKSGIGKFDFSALEAVPTLENTNAFFSTLTTSKIIVPDALYDTWKAATNWSTYADRIVKVSDYNG